MNVDILNCRWDEIIGVFRAASPAPGMYGKDRGGDLPKMLRRLNDHDLLAKVAREISEIERDYRVATASASQVIDAARKDREERYKALVASIKKA